MIPASTASSDTAGLERRIGLRSAVALNMLEMIGVGPFITLPLVIAAAGYRLSTWAWVLGAAIAVADGLVWAELGAAFPRAGGSYAFLREIYGPKKQGNWIGFLYVWQLSFSAPLSIASGCIGLASFLAWFWPGIDHAPFAALPALHYSSFAAAAACLLVTALLYRKLSIVAGVAWVLFAGVLAALAGVIVSGFAQASANGGWHMPAGPTQSVAVALGGLAQATLITTYDYWGYYNITFLGSEVRQPERTIPRAILLSVLFVSAFYVVMNLAALPAVHEAAGRIAGDASATIRLQLVADIAELRLRPLGGLHHRRIGDVDCVFVGVFAAAGLFASALCGGAGRQLFPLSGGGPSAPRHSAPVAGGAGIGGSVLLLLLPAAGDHHAGGNAHPAAVLLAADRGDAVARAEAGVGTAVSHSALSAAAAGGHGGLCVHLAESCARAGGAGCGGGNRCFGYGDLSGAGAAAEGVAVRTVI